MRNAKGGGSIVNVGSIMSSSASAEVAAYVACKRAGPGMTKVAAFEGLPLGASASIVFGLHRHGDNVKAIWKSGRSVRAQHRHNTVYNQAHCGAVGDCHVDCRVDAASLACPLGDESKFVTKAAWFVDGGL
ncbi:hypothetical protein CSHISOI_03008, partial [Colletotrichum shisoi]